MTMGWTGYHILNSVSQCSMHMDINGTASCGTTPVNPIFGVFQMVRVVNSVSSITESWGLKLLCYLLCLQGSDTEEKESRSSVTSSPNDKQIDPALWLWQSKQG